MNQQLDKPHSEPFVQLSDTRTEDGILGISAQCRVCPTWRMSRCTVNSLVHLADCEDIEEKASIHEAWHRSQSN